MNQTITLTVNAQEAQLVLAALCKLPYEVVAPLVGRLQHEAQSQLDASAAPAAQ